MTILYRSKLAAPRWADEQAAFADEKLEFQQGVAREVLSALDWLSDPMMADIACPHPDKSLDAWQLISEGGTIYLIGANKPHGSSGQDRDFR